MADFRNVVPPGACGWLWFLQATDPATDPNNHVGPGKLWIETDDDLAPTQVVGAHVWSVDDSAWIDWPIGTAASGGDADTLDTHDSTYFTNATNLASGTVPNARLDAELAAIAGLTSAADKGIQFTGSGTAATYDLTTAGKALLDDADATAQRVTLGLVIGTNVQAQDAELAALAGLTSAADKGIQFTGAGTAATYDLTAFAKTILDDANAAAVRTTIGVDASGSGTVADGSITLAKLADLAQDQFIGRTTASTGVPQTATITAAARTVLDDTTTGNMLTTLGAQPLDAELTAIAGLTSAADKVPYFTGSGTAAVTDLTTFGRSLIDDAAASNARTTLGLGTVATLASDTDGTLAANSDANIATQKATKTYVDSKSGFGGGAITHAYVGYNTIGASTEQMTTRMVYATKVTLASAGFIASIGAYIKSDALDHVGGLSVCLFEDNAGTPRYILAKSPVVNIDTFLQTAATTTAPRWMHVPVGYYATAGDYWLAVMDAGASTSRNVIYKDASVGAVRTYVSGGNWLADWGFYSPTTTSTAYSIRASVIS